MTLYLLDTDALIDFSKGAEPATSAILSWIDSTDVVAVCSITVAEFYSGLTPGQASDWEFFISSLPYWDITRSAAMRAGQRRYAGARAGQHTTTTDSLLAALAREQQATLVTGNAKHFARDDLSIFVLRSRRGFGTP